MRAWASVCVAALWVSAATAGIDLFLTRGPAGGGVPGEKAPDTFDPNEKDFLPNYEPWSTSAQRSPFVQALGRSETYFLWMEFDLEPGETHARAWGIDLRGSKVTGGAQLVDGLFYRQRGSPPNVFQRFYSDRKLKLPGLAGGFGEGVHAPILDGDIGNDVDGKTYALLGAIQLSGDTPPGTFQLGFGTSGFAVDITDEQGNTRTYTGTPNDRYPHLTIQGKNAYQGPYDAVVLLPEPASWLVLLLVAVTAAKPVRKGGCAL